MTDKKECWKLNPGYVDPCWKIKTIKLSPVCRFPELLLIDALYNGIFAIHQNIHAKEHYYNMHHSVTHIPTGAIIIRLPTIQACKDFVYEVGNFRWYLLEDKTQDVNEKCTIKFSHKTFSELFPDINAFEDVVNKYRKMYNCFPMIFGNITFQ